MSPETVITSISSKRSTEMWRPFALKPWLCMVAVGEADCYPRFAPTMEWDTSRPGRVCLAAGCDVLNWKPKALDVQPGGIAQPNPWFLVRGTAHDQRLTYSTRYATARVRFAPTVW